MKNSALFVSVVLMTVPSVSGWAAPGKDQAPTGWGASSKGMPPVPAELATGWTPAPLQFELQKPWDVDIAERYSYDAATDTHRLWTFKEDKPHAPPPNKTAPRSEMRFLHDYTEGIHRFDADVYVVGGTYSSIFQVWGRPSGGATTAMLLVHPDGRLTYGDKGQVLKTDANHTWFNLKVVHDPSGEGLVTVYIDNVLVGKFPGKGLYRPGFYQKCGVYSVRSGTRSEVWFRHIKLWTKGASSDRPKAAPGAAGGTEEI